MSHLNEQNDKQRFFQKKARPKRQIAVESSSQNVRRLLGSYSSFAANEAYKAARTNLLFTRVGTGCQKLAFTSTFASEGKTINCCNMALSLAQNGQKVLIIDADMRRPMVHSMFHISNEAGLSEFLACLPTKDGDAHAEHIPLVETQSANLYVLPSGHIPPNPAELLASARMTMLLDAVSEQFDYVLLDTPPVSIVTDAAVLIQNIQGYVLVVRAGMTPLDDLRGVVLKLEQLGANILGFMLNDLDAKSGSYKYSGSHGYGRYKKYGRYAYKKGYGRYAYQDTASAYGIPDKSTENNRK